jgi:hypothetical protein
MLFCNAMVIKMDLHPKVNMCGLSGLDAVEALGPTRMSYTDYKMSQATERVCIAQVILLGW